MATQDHQVTDEIIALYARVERLAADVGVNVDGLSAGDALGYADDGQTGAVGTHVVSLAGETGGRSGWVATSTRDGPDLAQDNVDDSHGNIDEIDDGYMSTLFDLMARRTLVRRPTPQPTTPNMDRAAADDPAINTRVEIPDLTPTPPSLSTIEHRLANIEQQLYPTFRRIGNTLHRPAKLSHSNNGTLDRKRVSPTRVADTTPIQPDFNDFLYWRNLQSPIADISDVNFSNPEKDDEDNTDRALVTEYMQASLASADLSTHTDTTPTRSNHHIDTLLHRISLLESLISKQHRDAQLAVERQQRHMDDLQRDVSRCMIRGVTPIVSVSNTTHVVVVSGKQASDTDSQSVQRSLKRLPVVPIKTELVPKSPRVNNDCIAKSVDEADSPVKWLALDDGWVSRDYYNKEMARRNALAGKADMSGAKLVAHHVSIPVSGERSRAVVGESVSGRPIVIVQPTVTDTSLRETSSASRREQDPRDVIETVTPQHVAPRDPHRVPKQANVVVNCRSDVSKPASAIVSHSEPSLKQVDGSNTTLIGDSIGRLLGEGRVSKKGQPEQRKFTDFLPIAMQPDGRGVQQDSRKRDHATESALSDASTTSSCIVRVLRWFNFMRSLVTAAYAMYAAIGALGNPYMNALGARGLWIATIFFVCVDVVVTFVRAWPRTFWVFWDVRDWDPYTKSWSVWSLVADHDLIIDIIPLLANVILRVYAYRATELVQTPSARGFLSQNATIPLQVSDIANPVYHSLILLAFFGATLLFTILMHTFRVWRVATFTRKSPALGSVVVLKAILLIFDIFTNGLLLYQTLVYSGLSFLSTTGLAQQLILSVVVPSPIITLTTNTLLNLPLHYTFLRMQLRGRMDTETGETGDTVTSMRILTASLRQTFHPIVVGIFGTYAAYSCIALLITMGKLIGFDPVDQIQSGTLPQGVVPSSGFFGWDGTTRTGLQTGSNILLGMAWLNVVANYAVGVVSSIVYWVYAFCVGVGATCRIPCLAN